MSQNIYILSDSENSSLAKLIDYQLVSNGIFESPNAELTESIILQMAKRCLVEYFYVIAANEEVLFPDFDFNFKPPEWDKQYIHIWNNNRTVRLFNAKEVVKNPSLFTDAALAAENAALKNIDTQIFTFPAFDIVFLSYGEPNADLHFDILKSRFPRVKRVDGIKGIKEAHIAAARQVTSNMFYVVDADADVVTDFNFLYKPEYYDNKFTHVWYSRNPVNGLEYGYGGVKLFPTRPVLNYTGNSVDFTTSVSSGIKVIPTVSNITKFNTDPFSTWKSAFRECVKLSTGVIDGQIPAESIERLLTWKNTGFGEFGEFSMLGARAGEDFGKMYINQPEILRLINDFEWLEDKFRH